MTHNNTATITALAMLLAAALAGPAAAAPMPRAAAQPAKAAKAPAKKDTQKTTKQSGTKKETKKDTPQNTSETAKHGKGKVKEKVAQTTKEVKKKAQRTVKETKQETKKETTKEAKKETKKETKHARKETAPGNTKEAKATPAPKAAEEKRQSASSRSRTKNITNLASARPAAPSESPATKDPIASFATASLVPPQEPAPPFSLAPVEVPDTSPAAARAAKAPKPAKNHQNSPDTQDEDGIARLAAARSLMDVSGSAEKTMPRPTAETTTKTATTVAEKKPGKTPEKSAAATSVPQHEQSLQMLLNAVRLIGTPYRWGGQSETKGFDCSGFVRAVVAQATGVTLPRTAREQAQVTQRIKTSELRAGDLVFFNTNGHANSHVGIYVGEGRFAHAPRKGAYVRLEKMTTSYWAKRLNSARRLPPLRLAGK